MPSDDSSGNQPVLLTGFEPYGGLDLNPSAALARELDGAEVAGHTIRGHVIPVALDGLEARLAGLIEDCAPALVLCLGLYPGEAVIRLERFGVNLADFEIPDNAGRRAQSQPLSVDAPTALAATLPLPEIQAALLARNIPAHISNSAGTYLCNAALFTTLRLCGDQPTVAGVGFIHLPYMPEQVARQLADGTGRHGAGGPPPSMALSLMREAVWTAIETALTHRSALRDGAAI